MRWFTSVNQSPSRNRRFGRSQRGFKRSLLQRIAWILVPLVVVAIGVVLAPVRFVRRFVYRVGVDTSIWHDAVSVTAAVLALTVFGWQAMALPAGGMAERIASTFVASFWLPLLCVVGLVVGVSLATLILRSSTRSWHQGYLVIHHLAVIGLILCMLYWNLGGMLAR